MLAGLIARERPSSNFLPFQGIDSKGRTVLAIRAHRNPTGAMLQCCNISLQANFNAKFRYTPTVLYCSCALLLRDWACFCAASRLSAQPSQGYLYNQGNKDRHNRGLGSKGRGTKASNKGTVQRSEQSVGNRSYGVSTYRYIRT